MVRHTLADSFLVAFISSILLASGLRHDVKTLLDMLKDSDSIGDDTTPAQTVPQYSPEIKPGRFPGESDAHLMQRRSEPEPRTILSLAANRPNPGIIDTQGKLPVEALGADLRTQFLLQKLRAERGLSSSFLPPGSYNQENALVVPVVLSEERINGFKDVDHGFKDVDWHTVDRALEEGTASTQGRKAVPSKFFERGLNSRALIGVRNLCLENCEGNPACADELFEATLMHQERGNTLLGGTWGPYKPQRAVLLLHTMVPMPVVPSSTEDELNLHQQKMQKINCARRAHRVWCEPTRTCVEWYGVPGGKPITCGQTA